MKKLPLALLAIALFAPAASFAQYYGTTYGQYYYPQNSYGYGGYVPMQGAYIYQPTYQVNYQPQSYYTPQYQYQSQSQYGYPTYGSGHGSYGGYGQGGYGNYGGYGYGSYDYAPPLSAGPQQGIPTGDSVWGNDICYYAGYGRAYCGADPRQPVYDPWTGTWY